ncbi:MAG TPA: hypothetical protein VI997_03835 [Candidatus Thermoplasmatota archaeon]|nr:hypothetical protein [Candidatus Thermoplasmatota archaeon]
MQARLGTQATLLAALCVFLPTLVAAEDGDGTITARNPVVLQGRALAEFSEGRGALASSAPATGELDIRAPVATVLHVHKEQMCREVAIVSCFPVYDPTAEADKAEDETFEIEDLRLVGNVSQLRPGTYVSWTQAAEDADAYSADGGSLVAEVLGAAKLGVPEEASAWDECEDWSDCGTYWPSATDDAWFFEGAVWEIRGDGFLRIHISGLDVFVNGVRDGEAVENVYYETGETNESVAAPAGGQELYRIQKSDYLVIEIEDGSFTLDAAAPGRIYGQPVVESFGEATFYEASGRILVGGERMFFQKEDATVGGNLTITPITTLEGPDDEPLLVLDVVGDVAAVTTNDLQASFPPGAAAVAVGVGGLALFGAALAYFWPYAKYAGTALVLPMYSRIGREEVLEHGKREEIFHLIRAEPGIHAHDISSRANVGWGTTVYHLKLLQTHGLVVGKRNGRYKRFFATAGGAARQGDAYAVLRNETTSAIARHVLGHPGCIQKDVCGALNLQPSLVTWHVNRLEEVDLVKKVRDGRTVRYYAGGSWGGLQLSFALPATPVTTPAVVDAGTN